MLARKTLLVFSTNILNGMLGLMATFTVARFMGPEILGSVSYLLGLVGLVAFFSDLGFSVTHVKIAAERDDVAEDIGAFFILKGSLTLVLMIIIYIAPLVSSWLGPDILTTPEQYTAYYILAHIYLFRGLSSLFRVTFRAKQEMAKVSIGLLMGSLTTSLAKISVALAGLGLLSLSIAYLLEELIYFLVGLLLFRGYQIQKPKFSTLKRYLSFALPVMSTFILSNIIANIDRVMLANWWSMTEVGYYVGVAGILRVVEQISGTSMLVFLPQSSQDNYNKRYDVIIERLFATEKYLLLLTVPVVVFIISFRESIVLLLLGEQFLPAMSILAVLALNALWKTFIRPYGSLSYALDKPHYQVIIMVVNLVVLIMANLILVPTTLFGIPMFGLGGVGAALSWLIKSLASGIALLYLLSRRNQIPIFVQGGWFLLAGGLMYITMASLEIGLAWQQFGYIPLLSLMGGGVFIASLFVFRQINQSDIRFLLQTCNPRPILTYILGELRSSQTKKVGS